MALTIREIENAKPAGKPYKMTDGGGLCLLIAPSGAKLWRWRYYFEGKEKMMAFGEYPFVPHQRCSRVALCSSQDSGRSA